MYLWVIFHILCKKFKGNFSSVLSLDLMQNEIAKGELRPKTSLDLQHHSLPQTKTESRDLHARASLGAC